MLRASLLPANFTLPPARRASPPESADPTTTDPPDWFPPRLPTASDLSGHRCGAHQMLTLVAYDITDPKRLHRAAVICEDWGLRVQYSVFECRLEAAAFDRFWTALSHVIDPKTDRLVAYKICAQCAREIHDLGLQPHNEKVIAYVC